MCVCHRFRFGWPGYLRLVPPAVIGAAGRGDSGSCSISVVFPPFVAVSFTRTSVPNYEDRITFSSSRRELRIGAFDVYIP